MSTRQKWVNPLKDPRVRQNLAATRVLAERGLLMDAAPDTVEDDVSGHDSLLDSVSTSRQQNGGEA